MGAVMQANVVIVIVNTLLLSGLLWMYISMLRQAPGRFTAGLTAFAAVLWLQNVVQLYFFATMMTFYVDDVAPLVLVQNILATIASLTLLTVTLRPVGAAAPA